jgi:hypothetical protein
MHEQYNLSWKILGLVVAGFAMPGCAGSQAGLASEKGNTLLVVPAEKVEFRRPIFFAPEMAGLWGDRSKGASGNMEKQAPGAVSALHKHPHKTYAVVLKGTFTHQFEGKAESPKLETGSYYTLPAEAPHVSTCVAGGDCLIAYWQPGALGYTEVKAGELAGKTFEEEEMVPAEAVRYEPTGTPGLSRALLWGQPGQEPSGTLERLAAEGSALATSLPVDLHGVVVAGTATLKAGDSPESGPLATGSYYVIPAGLPSTRTCAAGTDCLFLHFQPAP